MNSGIFRKYSPPQILEMQRHCRDTSGSWAWTSGLMRTPRYVLCVGWQVCIYLSPSSAYLSHLLLLTPNKYLYKYLFVLVRSFQNDLLPNKVPLLFNAEISFYYTWFQDHQIKGSCGQDLYCALSALCMRRGRSEGRHWGEERACENSLFSMTNISTSRACSISAPSPFN